MKKGILILVCVLSALLSVNSNYAFSQSYEYLYQFGSLGSGDSQFGYDMGPRGLVVIDQMLFICDYPNHHVKQFTISGEFVNKWYFGWVDDIDYDGNNFYLLCSPGLLYKLDKQMNVIWTRSVPSQAWRVDALCIDSEGNIHVNSGYEWGTHEIFKYDPDGNSLGSYGSEFLPHPDGVAAANGFVYVTDRYTDRVKKFTNEGEYIPGQDIVFPANADPYYIHIDKEGRIFVGLLLSCKLAVFSPTHELLYEWGERGNGPGQFSAIFGITTDDLGNVYVSDGGNQYYPPGSYRIQVFGKPNQPPKSMCRNITIPADSGCLTSIKPEDIDNGSYDPDDDLISVNVSDQGPFGLGQHTVLLIVEDEHGATDTCVATVTVVDNSAPVIANLKASPNLLWPPNHKMVQVTVTGFVNDNCDPAPKLKIIDVTSNEPENGFGDGDTSPDWILTGDMTLSLRAERVGNGTGRTYTILVQGTDHVGNTSTGAVLVFVPNNKKKK